MFNIYCDESCHLENDGNDIMVLGALSCPENIKSQINKDIRDIKIKHGVSSWFEIKWTKVSVGNIALYSDLIKYFFENDDLLFRGVIAKEKKNLDHSKYNDSSYDLWYYKMYYQLLDPITSPLHEYRIFIDIKDTRGGAKVKKLQEVLCNHKYDFNNEIIKDVKQIHSNESEIMQLCDLLIGALSFYHRGLYSADNSSNSKKVIINDVMAFSRVNFSYSTPIREEKFNLFIWRPRG